MPLDGLFFFFARSLSFLPNCLLAWRLLLSLPLPLDSCLSLSLARSLESRLFAAVKLYARARQPADCSLRSVLSFQLKSSVAA